MEIETGLLSFKLSLIFNGDFFADRVSLYYQCISASGGFIQDQFTSVSVRSRLKEVLFEIWRSERQLLCGNSFVMSLGSMRKRSK